MRLLAFVLAALFASPAAATGPVPIDRTPLSSAVINGLAVSTTRYTGWIDVSSRRSISWEIALTWNAASAVTMKCWTSDNSATANGSGFELHILEDSATSGTSNSLQHIWSNAVSASESWTWTISSLPHNYINCAFDGAGAGTDTVVVKHKEATP